MRNSVLFACVGLWFSLTLPASAGPVLCPPTNSMFAPLGGRWIDTNAIAFLGNHKCEFSAVKDNPSREDYRKIDRLNALIQARYRKHLVRGEGVHSLLVLTNVNGVIVERVRFVGSFEFKRGALW